MHLCSTFCRHLRFPCLCLSPALPCAHTSGRCIALHDMGSAVNAVPSREPAGRVWHGSAPRLPAAAAGWQPGPHSLRVTTSFALSYLRRVGTRAVGQRGWGAEQERQRHAPSSRPHPLPPAPSTAAAHLNTAGLRSIKCFCLGALGGRLTLVPSCRRQAAGGRNGAVDAWGGPLNHWTSALGRSALPALPHTQ